jgi:hypothetical protein
LDTLVLAGRAGRDRSSRGRVRPDNTGRDNCDPENDHDEAEGSGQRSEDRYQVLLHNGGPVFWTSIGITSRPRRGKTVRKFLSLNHFCVWPASDSGLTPAPTLHLTRTETSFLDE